jgi:hypothetical protein
MPCRFRAIMLRAGEMAEQIIENFGLRTPLPDVLVPRSNGHRGTIACPD